MCFSFFDRSCPDGDGGAAYNQRVRCGFPAHWWALAEAAGATTAADAGASENTRPVQRLLPRFYYADSVTDSCAHAHAAVSMLMRVI